MTSNRKQMDYVSRFTCPGCDGRIQPETMVMLGLCGPKLEKGYRELFFCDFCKRYVDELCLSGFLRQGKCPSCDGQLNFTSRAAKMIWPGPVVTAEVIHRPNPGNSTRLLGMG